MNISELKELIRVLESSSLSELEVEENGRRIRLSKGAPPMAVFSPQAGGTVLPVPMAAAPAAAPTGTDSAAPAAPEPEGEKFMTIDSPMVGTFYGSAAPGDAPFVVSGDTVEPEQTVCIIEAMKIMNEVTSKFAATIVKMLVDNGEPVEFGQPLFAVRPLE